MLGLRRSGEARSAEGIRGRCFGLAPLRSEVGRQGCEQGLLAAAQGEKEGGGRAELLLGHGDVVGEGAGLREKGWDNKGAEEVGSHGRNSSSLFAAAADSRGRRKTQLLLLLGAGHGEASARREEAFPAGEVRRGARRPGRGRWRPAGRERHGEETELPAGCRGDQGRRKKGRRLLLREGEGVVVVEQL
jgi:hypothetical protein|uniref:Uncharacterized protein n=1 Tax=Zea mays TaxID=4577 RepID=A0A804UFT6_MAIZE